MDVVGGWWETLGMFLGYGALGRCICALACAGLEAELNVTEKAAKHSSCLGFHQL